MLVLVPARAAADAADAPPPTARLRFSGLLGSALGVGRITPGGATLGEVMPPALLTGADVAFAPLRQLDFGVNALALLGLGEPNVCPGPSESCSLAAGGQLALRLRYHLWPEQTFNPWLAVGGGLDLLGTTGVTTDTRAGLLFNATTRTERRRIYWGPLGLLQVGGDYRLRRAVYVGGVLGYALGSYAHLEHSVRVDGETESSWSGNSPTQFHHWLYLAAQATFDVAL